MLFLPFAAMTISFSPTTMGVIGLLSDTSIGTDMSIAKEPSVDALARSGRTAAHTINATMTKAAFNGRSGGTNEPIKDLWIKYLEIKKEKV